MKTLIIHAAFIFSLQALVSGVSLGQTINGRVLDLSSGEALTNVHVLIVDTQTETFTNSKGVFSLTVESIDLDTGVYELKFVHESYHDARLNIRLVWQFPLRK